MKEDMTSKVHDNQFNILLNTSLHLCSFINVENFVGKKNVDPLKILAEIPAGDGTVMTTDDKMKD